MKAMKQKTTVFLVAVLLAATLCQPQAHAADRELKRLAAKDWTWQAARHLLTRAGYGGTADEVTALHKMGLEKAVDHLLNPKPATAPDGNDELDKLIDTNPLDRKDAEAGPKVELLIGTPQFEKVYNQTTIKPDKNHPVAAFSRVHMVDMLTEGKTGLGKGSIINDNWIIGVMRADWMQKKVTTDHPLEEKMVLFWHGLLPSDLATVDDSYMLFLQNYLFRKYAMNNYGELLHALMHDPAMLRYLDNNTNVKGNPNENLAREIMELFSMGEGKGYTEQDIKEGARALTGNKYDAKNKGLFWFDEQNHDFEPKTIFGHTGDFNADHFVDLILVQPATSRYMATRLFRHFAYEHPEPDIVEALSQTLRDSRYEVKPMLRQMFLSQAFYSDKAMGTQIKSPVQLVVGACREFGIKRTNYGAMAQATALMGQSLYQPPDVKGWDGGRAWINATRLFARQNLSGYFVEGKQTLFTNGRSIGGSRSRTDMATGLNVASLLRGKTFKNSSEVVDHFLKTMFAVRVSDARRQALIDFLDQDGSLPPSSRWKSQRTRVNEKLRALLVMMMSMPEYQLC